MTRHGRKRRWGFNERFRIGREGDPMMERWRLVQTPRFGIYVHFIYREDRDPVPHDHPWHFLRIVLRGWYVERYFEHAATSVGEVRAVRAFKPNLIRTSSAHRIGQVKPGTVSLVFVGRRVRDWGFWGPERLDVEREREWIDYRDALGLRPAEGVTS